MHTIELYCKFGDFRNMFSRSSMAGVVLFFSLLPSTTTLISGSATGFEVVNPVLQEDSKTWVSTRSLKATNETAVISAANSTDTTTSDNDSTAPNTENVTHDDGGGNEKTTKAKRGRLSKKQRVMITLTLLIILILCFATCRHIVWVKAGGYKLMAMSAEERLKLQEETQKRFYKKRGQWRPAYHPADGFNQDLAPEPTPPMITGTGLGPEFETQEIRRPGHSEDSRSRRRR
ncbi:hypothetical protein CYMTET_36908 [Cymbomonas tetramitiformis]|uniref:Transmembrane protein n=1 Tax=Cymbomonas tetramitiformis TaxID=36881 RepID=A0AAE0CGL3_9CHLO|nr:hypothetical protein CYMTET_36908 [Cymbomonas tetramitiformis]